MAWTDPRTWVTGELVTAALMNTHVRDNLKALGDPWTSYTPTWTATTTNPTLGNGTLTGKYLQVGKLVIGRIQVVFGSTTTAGSGAYSWALPATATLARMPVGACLAFDTSATTVNHRNAYTSTTTTVAAADESGGRVASGGPFTWATGDEIAIEFAYEVA